MTTGKSELPQRQAAAQMRRSKDNELVQKPQYTKTLLLHKRFFGFELCSCDKLLRKTNKKIWRNFRLKLKETKVFNDFCLDVRHSDIRRVLVCIS